MTTQHTPGPWTVESDQGGYAISSRGTDAPWQPHVANAWREADARLIAAAPRMLEALAKMERLATELFGDGDDVDGRARAQCIANMAEARAILRDVEG